MASSTQQTGQANILRGELERVLGEQMQIIQEQQAQATRIIRVGLTTAGLFLTILSIAASSGVLNVPNISQTTTALATIDISIIGILVATILIVSTTFIFLRIFAPALAVLNPDATDKFLNVPFPLFMRGKRSPEAILGEEHASIFDAKVSLRTGVDADKATELMDNDEIESEILEYHIGCVRGNEAIIEANRKHLSEIYRSTATAAFLLIGVLMYSLMGSVVLLS